MSRRFFNPSIRKSVASAAALGGFVSVTLLLGSSLAAAKPVTNASCHKKFESCLGRCLAKYSAWVGKPQYVDLVTNCNKRTCNKQYENCLKNVSVGSTGGKVETPPDPLTPKGGNPHTPPTGGVNDEPKMPTRADDTRPPFGGGLLGDGILGTGPGMGTTGPSATGSPVSSGGRAPAAAPIQLR